VAAGGGSRLRYGVTALSHIGHTSAEELGMFEFDLSLPELSLVGEAMGLDVRQYPFAFPDAEDGEDERESLRAAAEVDEVLAARGYVRGGEFVSEFADGLGMFCRTQPSMAVLGDGPDGLILGRAARRQPSGVLARQVADRMHVVLGDSGRLVASVLDLLPDHAPARGDPVTVPVTPEPEQEEDFSTFGYLETVAGPGGVQGGHRDRQHAQLRHLLDGEILGSGWILVERRDRYGAPDSSRSLRWTDTTTGRYAGYTVFGQGGVEQMRFLPADRELLGRTLDRFLAELGG
jgi:hypothetical protein